MAQDRNLTQAQTKELRNWNKGTNGQIDQMYLVNRMIADSEKVVSVLIDAAVTNVPTATPLDTGLTLPAGACITAIYQYLVTPFAASGGAGTLNTLNGAKVLVNAQTEASLNLTATYYFPTLITTTDICTVATASNLKLQAGTAAFDSGKIRIFVKYIMARD